MVPGPVGDTVEMRKRDSFPSVTASGKLLPLASAHSSAKTLALSSTGSTALPVLEVGPLAES